VIAIAVLYLKSDPRMAAASIRLAKSFALYLFFLGCFVTLTACSNTLSWQEEVKLNDGRLIVVTQKRRCDSAYTGGNMASCIEREAWLSFSLPEPGGREVEWRENLSPLVLNVHNGKFFIVGTPPTGREFNLYGNPQPPYLGFKLEGTQWKRIPFAEIPVEVYDTNLVIDGMFVKTKYLTLAEKNGPKMNGNPGYPPYFKRIDPSNKSNFH
jgi:hypothetical protein